MRRAGLLGLMLLLLVRAEVVFAQTTPPTLALTDRALTPGQIAVGAEALLWRFKPSPTPVPLVTDGYIGEPNTRVLLGGGSVDTGANPALRITAGYGLTSRSALEANVFYIPPRSTHAGIASTGKLGSSDLIIQNLQKKLKIMLHGTRMVKRHYYGDTMNIGDRARYCAEGLLLNVPGKLIMQLFRRLQYRQEP